MGEHVHEGPKTQSAQFQTEGGASMAPPAFSLGSSPIQKQDAGGMCEMPEEKISSDPDDGGMCMDESAKKGPQLLEGPLKKFDGPKAIKKNTSLQFRIDWVRNLQTSLLGSATSLDGSFDQATVDGVARFQMSFMPKHKADGIIDSATRRKLEETYPVLLSTVIGAHAEARILVPANANTEDRYGYWKGIIQAAGGVFDSNAMAVNLVGIRGVKISDGSKDHQIKGVIVPKDTIYQTNSAQDFLDARAVGTPNTHLSGDHKGFNDMIVSLWVDAKGVMNAKERIGNVDPNELYKDDEYGTGHLMDGQYSYKLGTHGTKSKTHKAAVNAIDDPDNKLGRTTGDDGKLRYAALTPTRNQEVWREHEGNDLSLSEKEETKSRDRIYDRNSRYVNSDFAMNIHSSSNEHPNSQACMNVPADSYMEFLGEIQGSSNKKNILYTLIDASKIEEGLVLMSQEKKK
jgi:hypothetical protein